MFSSSILRSSMGPVASEIACRIVAASIVAKLSAVYYTSAGSQRLTLVDSARYQIA